MRGKSLKQDATGDESLSGLPMDRIIGPLAEMGAHIEGRPISGRNGSFPPLTIHGRHLHGIDYTLPMASAQVKSAVLLAGLFADGVTTVTEPARTRDHTEIALAEFGAEVIRSVMSNGIERTDIRLAGVNHFIAKVPDSAELAEKPENSFVGLDHMGLRVRNIDVVVADPATVVSHQAVSIGLIVTELVMNALKHAFPGDRNDAAIGVSYKVADTDWKLTVSDNGIGKAEPSKDREKGGLGTSLIRALARQLDANVEIEISHGTAVSITHATFKAKPAKAEELPASRAGAV